MKLFLLIWWNLVAGTQLKCHCCPTHGGEGGYVIIYIYIYGKERTIKKFWGAKYQENIHPCKEKLMKEERKMLTKKVLDQFWVLRHFPPTPPLSQHFALSEK